MMDMVTCPCCGKELGEFALDVAFKRPEPFLRIPNDERDKRCWYSNDLCVIDGRHH